MHREAGLSIITSHTTTMNNITTETLDQELSLDQLNMISGGGKVWDKVKAGAKKVGDLIERTLGDGDGKHEFWDDYADEVFKVGAIVLGAGVVAGPDGKPCTDR
jgi:hypothetical protein